MMNELEDLRQRAAQLVCDCGHTGAKDLDAMVIATRNMDFQYSRISLLDFLRQKTAERFRHHKNTCGTWLAQQKWTTTRFPEGAEL